MDAPTPARAVAIAAQRDASDPAVSAFVAASAGSGKTKLLTDRVLRLMLGGADPARIQCLTYTRAAAAEMALRLQSVLGGWVGLPDAALDERLLALGVTPNDVARREARALFARVLDLPGGMRVGTIHAFCQSLLRRFPLEARISPHFGLLEPHEMHLTRRAAVEGVLGDAPPGADDALSRGAATEARRATIDRIAGRVNLARFDILVSALLEDRDRLLGLLRLSPETIAAEQRRHLCATGTEADWLDRAVRDFDAAALRDAFRDIAGNGPAKAAAAASERLAWLAGDATAREHGWEEYAASFFTGRDEPCSWKTLAGETLGKRRPELRAAMEAEQARITPIREALRAHETAALSAALLALALPAAKDYGRGKEASLRLDYADLIERTTALLRDPGAAWVLYKLDGGLDHLLLDEVQDTAPAQWAIAGALVDEFFAGSGARDTARTVFAVGDRKQSIFSFQGADPAGFDTWRERLAARVQHSGRVFRDVALNVSFRSTKPVLALVDAVFEDAAATPGVQPTEHRSDREGQAGSVELWPLTPRPAKEEPPPWAAPRETLRARSAHQRLAETVADFIAAELEAAALLPSRGRPLTPGDVLILLRRREPAAALVRALKQRGVPVAGLDRMPLTEQPAVMDLLALCETLLLPDDDLSLACVLTSPLGQLSDDDLIALAPGRAGSLWHALHVRADERPAWRACVDMLDRLFARVDYASPHALLAEALGPLGGRAKLLARLGPEAAEPLDELLAAALAHARAEPPSLQGFLHWLRGTGAEVKREPHGSEAGAGLVRIMTVHGAKGLQAPLVILPDTTALPKDDEPLLWADGEHGAVPIWCPHADLRCAGVTTLREAARARQTEEYNRLLYVALTRAEDRLVVCGAEPARVPADESWYRLIERGLRLVHPVASRFEHWDGMALQWQVPQEAPPDRAERPTPDAATAPLPAWAGAAPAWHATPPPPEPPLPTRLAPSRPENASLGPAPASASPLDTLGGDARFRRGRLLHGLLQHLPDLPAPERAAAARTYLSRPGVLPDAAEIDATLADIVAVLEHAALRPLFGPGSRAEVPLTGLVHGAVVGGLVDRLMVLPDRVLVADYKTTRRPPARAEDVPVLYLRQMAAYRAVLTAALPGRATECFLVWTTGALVQKLPDGLLDSHAPGFAAVDPAAASAHLLP